MHEDGSQAEEEAGESPGKLPADEICTGAEQQEGAASEEAARQAEAAVDLDDNDVIDLVNAASPQQAKKRR